jgi:hypothetical protein
MQVSASIDTVSDRLVLTAAVASGLLLSCTLRIALLLALSVTLLGVAGLAQAFSLVLGVDVRALRDLAVRKYARCACTSSYCIIRRVIGSSCVSNSISSTSSFRTSGTATTACATTSSSSSSTVVSKSWRFARACSALL